MASSDPRDADGSCSPACGGLVGQRGHLLSDPRRSYDRLVIAGCDRSTSLAGALPGYHAGRPPRSKGMRYPADPPTVEEIVAVMRHAAEDRHGYRLRGVIVVLWRAGLRVHEALALAEQDLDHRRGSLLVRRGKGGRRREVGMDEWGWEQLRPWLAARVVLPVGPLFCVIDGRTRGRPWAAAAVRSEFRRVAARAGVRRRFAPHPAKARARTRTCPRGCAAQHHSAPAGTLCG